MRRLIANAMLFLLAGVAILPYLTARFETNLPACCRRGGKHHCATMGGEPSSGTAFQAIAVKCPLYPRATLVARNHNACPRPAAAVHAGTSSHPALHAQADATYRVSNSRSHQKRGPPSAA